MKRFIIYLLLMVGFALPAQAAVGDLAWRQDGEKESLTLAIPPGTAAKVFTLANPDRLVVDMPTVPPGKVFALPADYAGTLIKNLRQGQNTPATTRLVLELNAPAASVESNSVAEGKEVQLTVSFRAGKKASTENVPVKKEAKKEKPAPAEKPLIIIDAGHGGQDPGATGQKGTWEKDLVLQYAKDLRKALLATNRYRVQLTRDADRFIMLPKRVEVARKAKADLFISLHADSAPGDDARGLSVYTLSEKASDSMAAALAEQENRVDEIYGLELKARSKEVVDILVSLAQRDTNTRSHALAEAIVDAMEEANVRLLNKPHRYAGFAVLKAPDIPSVLVEIGFLSSAEEEKLLRSNSHRKKLTRALSAGVKNYFDARKAQ